MHADTTTPAEGVLVPRRGLADGSDVASAAASNGYSQLRVFCKFQGARRIAPLPTRTGRMVVATGLTGGTAIQASHGVARKTRFQCASVPLVVPVMGDFLAGACIERCFYPRVYFILQVPGGKEGCSASDAHRAYGGRWQRHDDVFSAVVPGFTVHHCML